MRLVRQNYRNGAIGGALAGARGTARPAPTRPWTKNHRSRTTITLLTVTALAAGCAEATSTTVKPAAGQQLLKAPPARAMDAYATKLRQESSARATAAKRWGLTKPPLPAPPAPKKKPAISTRNGFEVDDHEGLPPVFTTIPTKDKVVFLTIDDGAEKDPVFLRMMSELKIPYTAFLSDYLVKEDYGYFKKMQDRGVVLNNHTLNHRYMPNLSYERQKQEICGMQDVIEKRYGKRPALFRPPFGSYNEDTLRAAGTCGIKAAPLWNEEVFVDRWDYRELDRDLHPGDIVLSHFRGKEHWKGTMPDMVRRFLKLVTDKGYAVARIEDYL
ncbi:polysaccharide deacetylase family protein [Streptomyces phaeochromogenes]|uniref:Polysaccharide deacetylase family protein n=1 Tax=Streptomyces phaeochromogenes TaxID=1923 RepID=A0ABZ1HAM9_STRPH|nr:polysaccharide deacetylase family protein [Streptomyces phaeochromogenes]WSD15643.1 polysaccharide deacetylase family protein [Streptomyces phaeochromogenes]